MKKPILTLYYACYIKYNYSTFRISHKSIGKLKCYMSYNEVFYMLYTTLLNMHVLSINAMCVQTTDTIDS